jgi:drug/metabolite transporter (DMT)-like permease
MRAAEESLDSAACSRKLSLPAFSAQLRGVLFMFGAVATFAVLDVGLKQLVATYLPMQVTFLRGICSLPLLFAAVAIFGSFGELATRRWALHLVRAVIGVATLVFFVYSVSILSLADAYAIFMCAPLLITALSMLLLGDRMDTRRWIAVCVGLVGVLLVLRPSGAGMLTLGGLAAFAAALGYALSVVTIRLMARTDTHAATVVWYIAGMTLISGIAAWPTWRALQWVDWPWLVMVGVGGALGQYLITQAFRLAPPSVVAPIEYTALAWGMLFDWFLWLVAPNLRMLIGAAVIVASGLYVMHRQAMAPAALTPAVPSTAAVQEQPLRASSNKDSA